MITSRAELEVALTKASTAVGLPPGQAREVAAAGRWLAMCHPEGVSGLVRAVVAADGVVGRPTDEPGAVGDAEGRWRIRPARALVHGTSAVELVLAGASAVTLEALDAAAPLLGLAGAVAERTDARFELTAEGGTAAVGPNGATIAGTWPPDGGRSTSVVVTPLSGASTARTVASGPDRVEIAEPLWQQLYALMARTYVPSTDRSRTSGAGAGLLDND